ncbi:RNA methyltransferase [Chamaesiphon sp. VAR_48_metabat_135_sub]|uniref:RNA methyltransferase n=1 Tax=Chamaesiphon sp. VAR_48_metabat_135_sub TaxID=2964699 RepID=UPI00286B2EC3|nr:RNA methyltransferase [Chamaesiphon sp. VAR_48_metabat_135_sub]
MNNLLHHIRIVLVEPAGALNIGSISRVMKNMGLTQLVIVNPQCEVCGEEASRMAVHAIDLLETAQIVPDLPTALAGCTRVIATTARARAIPTQLETPRQALPWLIESNEPTALIFGREDSGLTNAELNYATRYIRIPVGSEYSSLNLAQAVGVCAYELQICANPVEDNLSNFRSNIPPNLDIAPVELIEGYYQQLETLLLEIGYLLPHTAAHRMEKIRRLYNRSQLSPNEVALLRGILRQVHWSIDSTNSVSIHADKNEGF